MPMCPNFVVAMVQLIRNDLIDLSRDFDCHRSIVSGFAQTLVSVMDSIDIDVLSTANDNGKPYSRMDVPRPAKRSSCTPLASPRF